MRTLGARLVFLGVAALALGTTIAGAAGCAKLGSDYEPGIANPGYRPGHGRPYPGEAAHAALPDSGVNRANAGSA